MENIFVDSNYYTYTTLGYDFGSISLMSYNRANLITRHLIIITELYFYSFPIQSKLL